MTTAALSGFAASTASAHGRARSDLDPRLGGVFLVYTGLSLAFRRLWNWALWKRLRSAGRDPLGVPSSGPDAVSGTAVMD